MEWLIFNLITIFWAVVLFTIHHLFLVIILILFFTMGVPLIFWWQRRATMRGWAQENGWKFAEKGIACEDLSYRTLLMHEGINRFATNNVYGTWKGHSFHCFDLRWQITRGGRVAQDMPRYCSVLAMTSPVSLNGLTVHPGKFPDKMRRSWDFHGAQMKSEEFNRRFLVLTVNERWARNVLDGPVANFLLSNPRYSLQIDGKNVLLTTGKRVPPFKLAEALEFLAALVSALAAYPTEDLDSA